VVEHHLAKVGVAGSNPVVRSRSRRSEALSAIDRHDLGSEWGQTPREPSRRGLLAAHRRGPRRGARTSRGWPSRWSARAGRRPARHVPHVRSASWRGRVGGRSCGRAGGIRWRTFARAGSKWSARKLRCRLDADDLQVWESQRVTASARIPAGIAVTTTDRVRVLTPPEPALDGPWQISTIRYNGSNLRLILHR
jgi:hypothetical protein